METKKTVYKVQTGFRGNNTPTCCTSFDDINKARKNYAFQAERDDVSFVNLIKVECEVVCGEMGESDDVTFRFCV